MSGEFGIDLAKLNDKLSEPAGIELDRWGETDRDRRAAAAAVAAAGPPRKAAQAASPPVVARTRAEAVAAAQAAREAAQADVVVERPLSPDELRQHLGWDEPE